MTTTTTTTTTRRITDERGILRAGITVRVGRCDAPRGCRTRTRGRSRAWDRVTLKCARASAGAARSIGVKERGREHRNRGRCALERDERDGFDLIGFVSLARHDGRLTLRARFSHRSHSRLLFRNPSSRSASATSSGLPKRLPLPPRPRLRAKRSVRKSSSARRSMSRSTATR